MRLSPALDPSMSGSMPAHPAPKGVSRQPRAGRWARTAATAAGAFGLLVAVSTRSWAATEDPMREAAVHIARLHYEGGGDWYSNPSSMPNWMRGFQERTGIATVSEEVQIRPDDDGLFRYPIAYMNGHGNVRFSDEDLRALRTWIAAGGFLWADDNYGMDLSFRREIKRLFPDHDMFELPNNHPIFHCYYQLPGLPKIHEHDGKPPQLFGIVDKGRLVAIYSYQSDIGDGLEDPEVHHDTPEKREYAMRMAVNVLWYALTH
jgi:hypothetical protein